MGRIILLGLLLLEKNATFSSSVTSMIIHVEPQHWVSFFCVLRNGSFGCPHLIPRFMSLWFLCLLALAVQWASVSWKTYVSLAFPCTPKTHDEMHDEDSVTLPRSSLCSQWQQHDAHAQCAASGALVRNKRLLCLQSLSSFQVLFSECTLN